MGAERIVKVGLIGCGNVSVNDHAPALRDLPSVEALAIADPVRGRRERVRAILGLPEEACFASHADMLRYRTLDYVLVAVPPAKRGEIVASCAAKRVNVLCEKPLATRPAEARQFQDLMASAGLKLGMVHNYLYYPEYVLLRELIEAGEVGQIRHISLNFLGVPDNPGAAEYRPQWRHEPQFGGGGVLMDMIHALYLAEYLTAEPIQAVSATIDNLGNRGDVVEDLALVHLYFENSYVTVNMGWGHGPGGVEVTGRDGRIMIFYNDFGTGPFSSLARFTLFNRAGRRDYQPRQNHRSLDNFVNIHQDFAEAIRSDRTPVAPATVGARCLEAAMAAYASAVEGKVVSLPLDVDNPVYQRGVAGLRELPAWAGNRLAKRGLFGFGR